MSMNFNPSELKEAILCRLPLKSLLRFRCVSKPWRSLFDDPYFVKLHLKQSIETNTNISLIIRETKLYSTDLDLVGKRKPEELDHPLNLKPSNTERFVVGSCNGLLCLVNRRNIVLWNTSTRKYHLLPDMSVPYPNFPKPDLHLEVYGFAYDSINDDYKVLSILDPEFYTDRRGLEPVVIIYSLRANTWRWIQFDSSYRCIFYCKQSGILSNGALHWIESGLECRGFKCPKFLIAFDLALEEFRKVPLPDDSKGADRLQVLEGCLSVMKMDRNVGVDIWVMKVYGVKDSWTKFFSFANEKMVYYCLSHPIPISYSKSGDKLLFH